MSYLSFSSIISLIGLLFVPIGYWHKPFLSTAWLLCGIFAVCAVIFDPTFRT